MTNNRRHVVFVSQMFPPDTGGNASRIHDNAVNLVDYGWDVTVLAPPPSYPPGEFDRSWQRSETDSADGVTVHRLWTYQPQTEDPGMGKRLLYYLIFAIHSTFWLVWNVRRYDIVVTSTPPISTGGPGLLVSVLGKPWVVDVRDLWIDASIALEYLEQGTAIERLSRRFQRLVLHTADSITVTTRGTAESLKETYGDALGEKFVELPNGVNVGRFERTDPQPTATDREAVVSAGHGSSEHGQSGSTQPLGENTAAGFRAQSNSRNDSDTDVIIYTGNLGSAQDLESFIRAMTHLESEDVVLRLVGGGDRKSQLRALARQLSVQDSVEFVEPVPREEVPSLLCEATVGIAPLKNSPELEYAIPTKVYEYLACGLPVVVTGRGEIDRVVSESGGGVVAENDAERIANRLDELLDDKRRRRQLGQQGQKFVSRNYDREAIAGRLSVELDRFLDER